MSPTIWAAIISGLIALLIAFSTLLATVIYRTGFLTGQLSTRVDSLEVWRGNVRSDLHEVSDKLEAAAVKMEGIATQLRAVHQLIDERTERRIGERAVPDECPLTVGPPTPRPRRAGV